jgi:hypothetical protein
MEWSIGVTPATAILAIARADFLERVRRYSFLFTLGFALYLGYLATTGKLVFRVGHMRGLFNSAWVGGLLSLIASAFISLAGFYFIKNTIQRDRETGVGQIIAATPVSKFTYTLGKMTSNFMVLGLMVVVLACSGIVMQLIRGEDRHIELWKLLAPFLLLSLPAMLVVASVAVLFEAIPVLSGGFGNIVYFFAWAVGLSSLGSKWTCFRFDGNVRRSAQCFKCGAPTAAEQRLFSVLRFGVLRLPTFHIPVGRHRLDDGNGDDSAWLGCVLTRAGGLIGILLRPV